MSILSPTDDEKVGFLVKCSSFSPLLFTRAKTSMLSQTKICHPMVEIHMYFVEFVDFCILHFHIHIFTICWCDTKLKQMGIFHNMIPKFSCFISRPELCCLLRTVLDITMQQPGGSFPADKVPNRATRQN